MERNVDIEDALREVLSISTDQKVMFAENRLADLLDGQRRKQTLLAKLGKGPDYKKEPYASFISEIVASDRVLSMGVEALKDEVGDRLKRLRSGVKAMKAYGGGL